MNGYFKIHRQLTEWEWYTDIKVKSLFIHCLLLANFKDKRWRGELIKRGQFITSIAKLEECGLTYQEVRTALEKLVKTGEIKKESTGSFTLITVCNYDTYQQKDDYEQQTSNKAPTDEQQSSNKAPTDEQQLLKKEKNDNKEEERKEKYIYLDKFEKISKGDLTSSTSFEKNFNFALFPDEWSDRFKDSVLEMFEYLQNRENKPYYWGNIGTLNSQISVLKASLQDYSENEIILAFDRCKFASKKSWNMYLKHDDKQNVSSDYEFPYKLPTFSNSDERWRFFLNRFNQYKPEINRQEYNSLRKRALNGKEAEQVCKELETKYEHLSKIELQWQHTT